MAANIPVSTNRRRARALEQAYAAAGQQLGLAAAPQIQNATLGRAVERQAYVDPNVQGKYLGLGTYENANQGFFNTKQNVLLTNQWVAILNGLLNQARPQNIPAGQYFGGLSGDYLGGGAGPYFTEVVQYLPDDRARITVSVVNGNTTIAAPGSTAQIAAAALGRAVGLVYVMNPTNSTGYLRAGSPGWLRLLNDYAAGEIQANDEEMQHLAGQGGVYGLGPVYQFHGLDVRVRPGTGTAAAPARYYVVDANTGQEVPISRFSAKGLGRHIRAFYSTYLKNPDQVRLGQYGAAALALRQADKMNIGNTGGAADPQAVSAAVLSQFANTGSIRGADVRWANGYTTGPSRQGTTVHPVRGPNGEALRGEQAAFAAEGYCDGTDSGPGVSQSAKANAGPWDLRFYKRITRGRNGRKSASCVTTPSQLINPDRAVYGPNGARAIGGQVGLAQFLDQYGGDLNADALRAEYGAWATNPDNVPFFMNDPTTGARGFGRWLPNYWADQIPNPQQQQLFLNTNLSMQRKAAQSQALAERYAGPGALPK